MIKLCFISNTASHYRASIFKLIDDSYETSFFFSEPFEQIKLMDYNILKGPVKELKTWRWHNFSYQHGVLILLNKKYDKYITLGDVRSISTWLFLIIARVIRKPVYIWTHGWYGKETGVEVRVKKLFYRLPKGILLYGNYAKELMIKEGVSPSKLYVLHNSLDYSSQLVLRKELVLKPVYQDHFGNKNQTLILICRLTPRKRIDMLIDALSSLKAKGLLYNAVIVGDGNEREKLQSQAKQCGVDNQIWFYGPCYDEKTNAELIYNSDLCVTPGDIGLTAIHVMMFGVPVLTHDDYPHQGPEFEAIHVGLTGAFFKSGSVESLSESIVSWLTTHKNDRDEIRQACFREIDTQWTPGFQLQVIKSALDTNH